MEEAPKVKVKYNKELLDACLERDGASLVGEYEKITCETKIKFICKCGVDGEKILRSIIKYSGLCCINCSNLLKMKKSKKTNLERYGYEYTTQTQKMKEKTKETNLKLLGVEYPTQSKIIKEKCKKTNLERYGVEFISQTKSFQEKVKKTNLDKRGVTCSLKSDDIKEKIKNTMKLKYNVEHNFQSGDLRDKRITTFINKYGVEHPAQNPEVFAKQQKNSKKFKTYTMPSGAIRQVQGYEPFALDALIKHYREDAILTERGAVPRVPYKTSEGKQRYYFPDIYIPHENKIIEVKSTWTYKCKSDNVQEKIQATTAAGYAYELWCFNAKGERVDVAAAPEAEPPRPSRIQRRPASGGAEEVESEAPESEKE